LIADQKLPDNDSMQSCGPLESLLASASNITPLQITARPSLFSLVEIEPSDLALEALVTSQRHTMATCYSRTMPSMRKHSAARSHKKIRSDSSSSQPSPLIIKNQQGLVETGRTDVTVRTPPCSRIRSQDKIAILIDEQPQPATTPRLDAADVRECG
jgi:hypothetical protein